MTEIIASYDWQGKEVDLSEVINVSVSRDIDWEYIKNDRWWKRFTKLETKHFIHFQVEAMMKNGDVICHTTTVNDFWKNSDQAKAYMLRNELLFAVEKYLRSQMT